MKGESEAAALRRMVYTLVIAVAAAMATGRILAVLRVYEPDLHRPEPTEPGDYRPAWPRSRPAPSPTFSSNDRSRWATVRSLVEQGTYVIGRRNHDIVVESAAATLSANGLFSALALCQAGFQARVASDKGIVFEDGYQTVDKVLHPTRLEFYSTKPPLLTTLVAGEYWLLHRLLGWSLRDQPFAVVRCILITINVLPLVLYLSLLAWVVERFTEDDWSRLFVVTAGAFGTLVTPFLVTFNNHTVAVVTTMIALACTLRIWSARDADDRASWLFVVAGLSSGFNTCFETPALALAAGLFLVLLGCSPRKTLLGFVPALILPLAAQELANWIATGDFQLMYAKFGGPWYQYEGSHWRIVPGRRGIDWAANYETRGTYAFHLLLGHHGLFSLTPIFLLSFGALVWQSLSWKNEGGKMKDETKQASDSSFIIPPSSFRGPLPWLLFPAVLGLSLVVIGFYLVKSDNYGGWSSGPRWLLWLTPLWLITMLPTLRPLGRSRLGRAVAIALLVVSVISASFPAWNPWRHPWIYRFLDSQGLIPY